LTEKEKEEKNKRTVFYRIPTDNLENKFVNLMLPDFLGQEVGGLWITCASEAGKCTRGWEVIVLQIS